MAEYIDKEKFLDWVNETYCKPCKTKKRDWNYIRCGECGVADIFDSVLHFPVADVQEVRHGRWILLERQDENDVRNHNYHYECSACGYSDIHAKAQDVPYCWHCGATMEVNDD